MLCAYLIRTIHTKESLQSTRHRVSIKAKGFIRLRPGKKDNETYFFNPCLKKIQKSKHIVFIHNPGNQPMKTLSVRLLCCNQCCQLIKKTKNLINHNREFNLITIN